MEGERRLTPRRIAVFLNARAGRIAGVDESATARQIEAAFAMESVDSTVSLVPPAELPRAVGDAARDGFDAVAVGGGDGTIGAAASALAGTATPLGVLPLGTLNHFARDLGMPRDLGDAVRAIARGRVRAVDVGEIGGHVFLNNASIGFYAEVVDDRDERRARGGLGRRTAMLQAFVGVLKRFPLLSVRLEADGEPLVLRTPFVFVGNNAYELKLLELGRRAALDRGELSLYVARHETRSGLLRLVLRALAGRLHQDRDFRALSVPELTIESRRPWLPVAADGEVRQVRPPIRYRILPRALWVVVPEA